MTDDVRRVTHLIEAYGAGHETIHNSETGDSAFMPWEYHEAREKRIEELEDELNAEMTMLSECDVIFTTAQINEAWAFVIDPPGYLSAEAKDAVEAALGAFGIIPCPKCKGTKNQNTGFSSAFVECDCPNNGWVIEEG